MDTRLTTVEELQDDSDIARLKFEEKTKETAKTLASKVKEVGNNVTAVSASVKATDFKLKLSVIEDMQIDSDLERQDFEEKLKGKAKELSSKIKNVENNISDIQAGVKAREEDSEAEDVRLTTIEELQDESILEKHEFEDKLNGKAKLLASKVANAENNIKALRAELG